jgi:hypothetical protein
MLKSPVAATRIAKPRRSLTSTPSGYYIVVVSPEATRI